MRARQKLNEAYVIGIGVFAVIVGLTFASIDMAVLFGVVLFAAAVMAGNVRLSFDERYKPPQRSQRRRR